MLSSWEAEWVALSEDVELMFMIQLLGGRKISVKHQVMVRVDDLEAILMASNIATMPHTKHIDIRHKYANKYVKDKVVKIIFVKSAKNDRNILSKI